MNSIFKERTIQKALLIGAVLLLCFILFELKYFVSGLLGSIVLYVVCRKTFLKWIETYRWPKEVSIWVMLFVIVVCFGVPIWLILELLIPRINEIAQHPQKIIENFEPVITYFQTNEFIQRFDFSINQEQILAIVNRVLGYIPSTLNWVGQFFANIFVALFILYFLLSSNRELEKELKDFLPFSPRAKAYFIKENKALIRSNAYGVPILAFSQGLIAALGFYLFDVPQPIFWGLLTAIASVVPVVGTMVIWIPVAIYQIATGDLQGGLFLALYCFIFVGGIDNVLRFTLLKTMADIHPLITVFGVLLGLQLFGAMGLVFGPWLLSIPFILFKVYRLQKQEPDFLNEPTPPNRVEPIEAPSVEASEELQP